MSERRLRELGTFDTEGGAERCAFCHVLVSAGEHYPQCPVDDDPDVVLVLRMMSEWKERHIGSETGYAFAPPDVLLMTLEAAINDIQDAFHVRLTNDGYEWADA